MELVPIIGFPLISTYSTSFHRLPPLSTCTEINIAKPTFGAKSIARPTFGFDRGRRSVPSFGCLLPIIACRFRFQVSVFQECLRYVDLRQRMAAQNRICLDRPSL
jgi:hypothetical protein